jgi:hypothetical protein
MAKRKKRTREHIIAGLSINHIERFALLDGFSIVIVYDDYGYDVLLFTYDKNGEFENGYVYIQLKATDNLRLIKNNTIISFPVDKRDISLWRKELYPVIFIVYDAQKNKGYWLYIQEYLKSLQNFSFTKIGKTYNIHIPLSNTIDRKAMKKFAKYKNDLINKLNI